MIMEIKEVSKVEKVDVSKEVYKSDFNRVFFNEHKKYGISMSIKVEGTEFENFAKLIEEEYCDIGKYINFKLDKNVKLFDMDKNEVDIKDLEKIIMDYDIRLIFTGKSYKKDGNDRIAFTVRQIQFRERENKFKVSLF